MSDGLYKKLKISSRDIGEVEEYLSEAYAPVAVMPLGSHDNYGVTGQLAVIDEVFVGDHRFVSRYSHCDVRRCSV